MTDGGRLRPDVDLPALYSALDCAKLTIVFSSRDWSRHKEDVILYAIFVGWGCEGDGVDDLDEPGDGLERFAERFGWNEKMITRIRTLRSAVKAFDVNAIGDLSATAGSKAE